LETARSSSRADAAGSWSGRVARGANAPGCRRWISANVEVDVPVGDEVEVAGVVNQPPAVRVAGHAAGVARMLLDLVEVGERIVVGVEIDLHRFLR